MCQPNWFCRPIIILGRPQKGFFETALGHALSSSGSFTDLITIMSCTHEQARSVAWLLSMMMLQIGVTCVNFAVCMHASCQEWLGAGVDADLGGACLQAPILAYVGRLAAQKGMDVFLSALPALFNAPSLQGQLKS